ncbi:glycosyltransferase family 25 protein [Apiospora arundinis]|uniref:Glycosyltransferase family 25 protein n=1 Tax=Apiospora arundinis TaxID=335852 RepID=A0ABR2HP94_9PEZI
MMEPPSWFWAILLAWLVGRDVINSSRLASSKEKKVESKRSRLGLLTTATLVVLAVACLLPTITSILSDSVPDVLEVGQAPPSEEEYTGQRVAAQEDDVARIQNATLGFQKVFVVNLPDRTDKRDALSLVGTLTGIKLDWVRALRGVDVPDKALPLGVDRQGWRDGGIGSWRSQMNAIRTMVEENISSALILEDDADWDVRLKQQLMDIADGTRTLLGIAKQEPVFQANSLPVVASDATSSVVEQPPPQQPAVPHSPYGDDWDILWLGHCGETFPERIPGHEVVDLASARYTYYAMRDDETMPPLANTSSWINGDLRREPGTRWVHFSGGPTCSAGYALSQSGARKVLHALSVGGTLIAQLDNAMADLCRDHTPWDAISSTRVSSVTNKPPPPGYRGARMRCLSVTPAVISQHKPRGRRAAESDIESVENGHEIREKGESPNLVWSARLNVQNLILGLPMENQFEALEGSSGLEELDP